MLPMEGQQKKIQYSEWYKKTTGKRLWSGKDKEISNDRFLKKYKQHDITSALYDFNAG